MCFSLHYYKGIICVTFCLLIGFEVSFAQKSSMFWGTALESKATHFKCFKTGLDSKGNILLAGYFKGTMDFKPGPEVMNISSKGTGTNLYFLKLKPDGSFGWIKYMEADGANTINDLGFDSNDNIVFVGTFFGKIDMDPGPNKKEFTNPKSTTGEEAIIGKLDENGNFLAAAHFKSDKYSRALGLGLDATGQIFVTGYCSGSTDFDPTSQEHIIVREESVGFLCRLNENCNLIDVKIFDSNYACRIKEIKFDKDENFLLHGFFISTVDIDPSDEVYNLVSTGSNNYDEFIVKFNPQGELLWAKHFKNGNSTVIFTYLEIDGRGDVYLAKDFLNSIKPNPANDNLVYTSRGRSDIAITKLNADGEYQWSHQIGHNGNESLLDFEIDVNNEIYFSGDFEGTVDFDPGAEDFKLTGKGVNDVEPFVCKLTGNGDFRWAREIVPTGSAKGGEINLMPDLSYYITCNFYPSVNFYPEGEAYNTSGTGHNNIGIARLTQAFGVDHVKACNNYTWQNGVTYTENNNDALHLFQNNEGLDTLILLNLEINVLNTDITEIENKLSVFQDNATYRWLDCNNNFTAIPDAINKEFLPTYSSSFAAEITTEHCTDTTACIDVTILNTHVFEQSVNIYPNPVSNELMINYNQANGLYTIINSAGMHLVAGNLENGLNKLDLSALPKGSYIIFIRTGQNAFSKKFVIID